MTFGFGTTRVLQIIGQNSIALLGKSYFSKFQKLKNRTKWKIHQNTFWSNFKVKFTDHIIPGGVPKMEIELFCLTWRWHFDWLKCDKPWFSCFLGLVDMSRVPQTHYVWCWIHQSTSNHWSTLNSPFWEILFFSEFQKLKNRTNWKIHQNTVWSNFKVKFTDHIIPGGIPKWRSNYFA